MFIYESHLGGLYALNKEADEEELYCDECGDHDWLIGYASNRAEAWELLKDDTTTFDFSMCESCPHDGDDDYCNYECKAFQHSGGWSLEYVQKFIEENWDE